MLELSTGRGFKRALRFFAFSALCFAPAVSHAGSPVLIEFYGNSYKCSRSKVVELEVEEVLRSYPDAIVLNCRVENTLSLSDKEPFGRPFCREGQVGYFLSLRLFSMPMPMLIVNGRYDANSGNIEAAMKAALSVDQVKPIEVSGAMGGLNIRIPEGVGKGGELYLYTYASFEKSDDAVVDGQNAYRPKAALRFGEEGVFDGDKPFRPVVGREKIADWRGGALEFTYPIKPDAFPDYSGATLGYVVVLHESGLFSPVLATGELAAPDIFYSGPGEEPVLPLTERVLPLDLDPEIPQAPPS